MPIRPRSHSLETESELAFERAIPSRWVYRRKDKDYGIDGEVEIFDEEGRATGCIFLVQLKATDSPNLRQALRVSLRIATGRYYASLDLPLLMVRYHAPTQTLYARWFHSLDVYYGRRTSKSVTFYFDDENRWIPSTVAAIEQSIAAFRNTSQPSPTLPIDICIQIANERVHGVPRPEFVTRLARAAREMRHLVRLEISASVSTEAPNRIRVAEDQIAVLIGHRPVMTIHTAKGIPEATARDSLASDVLMALGLGFDWLGHPILAADILVALNATSSLTRHLPTAFAISRCLARARRLDDALQIARRLMLDQGEMDLGHVLLLPVLCDSVRDAGKRGTAMNQIAELAHELARRGRSQQAAALHYNCGNALRGANEPRAALHQYRLARKLDRGYLERYYFEAEMGGVLYLLGRYTLSAKHYRRSVELHRDRNTQLLYADALLFCGRYREALDLITEAIGESRDIVDAEWILKEHALTRMLAGGLPGTQKRRRRALPDMREPSRLSSDEIVRACEQALDNDGLSGWAWFNLGNTLSQVGDRAGARDCYLIAALVCPSDIEAWGNAVALSFNLGDSTNTALILQTAHRMNEEDFALHVLERVPAPMRDAFAAAISNLNSLSAESRKKPYVIRVHQPLGTWIESSFDSED